MALALKDKYSYADFMQAYLDCRRRKRRTPKQLQFEMLLEDNLARLMDEVNEERYKIGASRAFTIMVPKPREIWAAQFRDRIVHHLLYNEMGAYFERRLIEDTYSCIPARGSLAAMKRAQKFMRKVSENFARPGFFLQADIRNFFVSINRGLLWEIVREHSGEASLGARLARQVILHDPTSNAIVKPGSEFGKIPPHKSLWKAKPGHGLPIGNLTSQFLSNVYLNGFDQFVKHTLKVRFYLRYVDDVVFFSQDRDQLWQWLEECDNWLKKWRGLMFHPDKSLVAPVSQGLNFVGWIILPWRVYPRRRTVAAAKERRDNPASLTSYMGIFKHCNAYNLIQKFTAPEGL